MKVTKEQVIRALKQAKGNIAAAARALGLARCSLHLRIQNHPDLIKLVNDFREARIDRAESIIDWALGKKKPWAVAMVLKGPGKNRGWVERQEQEQIGTVRMEIVEEIVDAGSPHSTQDDPPAPGPA